ncbi:MAG: tol-pal system protein YbgF [Gemmatimonadetes bacterium]|nr:tol-pal system protein YbgF [Gemmatimonadota bacterium]NNM06814.1 tol-pal system protein YbgF [Gemmatimonadota bacterium]
MGLFGLALSGCATKGDLRSLQDEIREMGARQQEEIRELSGLNMAVQDTLGRQSDAIFESRGDINRRLQLLEQEILTIQELLRMNQQSLMTIRDLLESRRSVAGSTFQTDTEPRPGGFTPAAEVAGGPVEMYNTAATQFNNGSLNTARRAFQQFLREYPTDALADDARYYLADILVQEERLEEAIPAFLRIQEDFPTADMVPQALYRVGEIYIRLDQLEDARQYLERVVNTYPGTDAAREAQERLDEIG